MTEEVPHLRYRDVMGGVNLRGLARSSARALAGIRCAIGVGALFRPEVAAAPWVGSSESRRASIRLFGQVLGGRDLALGMGALLAPTNRELRRMAALGVMADTVDFLSTARHFRQLSRAGRYLVLTSTFGAATAGAIAALSLRQEPSMLAEAVIPLAPLRNRCRRGRVRTR